MPLTIGLLGLALISPTLTYPVLAQEQQMMRTVTVTGQGSESIPATLAQISLAVEVQGENAEEVQRQVAERSNAVVNFLQSRAVRELQTTGVYLSPTYDYNSGNQQITGYIGSNSVSFQVPADDAGSLLDEAVGVGATRIDGVSFVADDAAIATARQQAIREATQDAQSQASAALDVLGFSPNEIVSIQINGAYAPPPVPYRAALQAEADASTPIVAGEQEVQASVTLQISY